MSPTRPFAPAAASLRWFRPRAWLAWIPADEVPPAVLEADPGGETSWALGIFNGGPPLRELSLQILEEASGSPRQFRFGSLEEGGAAWLRGSGSENPPAGLCRIQARSLHGSRVSWEVRLDDPPSVASRVPLRVRQAGGRPLGPCAPWHPLEIARELDHCSLISATEDLGDANRTLAAWCEAILRRQERVPSLPAAAEMARAGLQAVFGLSTEDLEEPVLGLRLEQLAQGLRRWAEYLVDLQRPQQRLPSGDLALALVENPAGGRPALYLCNEQQNEVRDLEVEVFGLRWSERPSVRCARTIRIPRLGPHQVQRLILLDPEEVDSTLECTVRCRDPRFEAPVEHHGWFPAGAIRDRESLVRLDLLGRAAAQVRRMERVGLAGEDPDPREAA